MAELIGTTAELRDADLALRRAREDEIDVLIAAWTADRVPAALRFAEIVLEWAAG